MIDATTVPGAHWVSLAAAVMTAIGTTLVMLSFLFAQRNAERYFVWSVVGTAIVGLGATLGFWTTFYLSSFHSKFVFWIVVAIAAGLAAFAVLAFELSSRERIHMRASSNART
jgi:MFS family permease